MMNKETKERLKKLISSGKKAIELLTEEIEKPIDEELQDDKGRNAFKAKRECFMDARELITEIEKIQNIIEGKEEEATDSTKTEFNAGHAEKFAKGI